MPQSSKISKPPQWIDRWLERNIDPFLLEGVLGDLYEKFYLTSSQKGNTVAQLGYILNGLGYLRYFSLKNRNSRSNFEAMFKNYLTITLRTFKRHKAYSFINLFGLAVGLTAGFIILQYVHYQFNYDTHLDNRENIYRVQLDRYNKGERTTRWAAGCAGIGPDMKAAFPEVEKIVKITSSNTTLKYNNRYIKIPSAYYATEDFFEVFSLPLLSGVDSLVLKEPFKVVLSESTARNIFGEDDPLGKEVRLNEHTDFEVVGIFKDLPEQSHMKINLLYSFETLVAWNGEGVNTEWDWDGYMTYVQLKDGTNPLALEAKIPALKEEKVGERYKERNEDAIFHLQPVDQIHLTSNFIGEFKVNGNKQTTYFLLIVGIFIIAIAWVNYINLTTARAMQRAKEVGVRKVLGSFRSQLIKQFLFESVFINLVSLIMAAVAVFIFYPYFNDFVGINAPYTLPNDPVFWTAFGLVLVLGTFLSGFYPAIVLSGFKPVTVLTGKFETSKSGNLLRKSLVVFQFLTSIILITGTYAVYQQMQFLQSQDLGFKIDQTMILRIPTYNEDSVYTLHYDVFKSSMLGESEIQALSASSTVPGRKPATNAGGIRLIHQSESEANQYRIIYMDDQFLDLYDINMTAGRGFDRTFGNERENVLVNQSAVKMLGVSSADELINQKMQFWGDTFNIVGVVENYRQKAPKGSYEPLVFRYRKNTGGYYSLKVSSSYMPNLVAKIEDHWRNAYNEKPLEYFFLDDYYNEQYKTEVRFGSVFGFFAGLAILVACMGLFGLASYATSLRIKEVSVRKVLGAQLSQLLLLLAKDFLKLVGIAILISVPLTYYLINLWLENFANRISISALIFIVPALVLIIIALLTVSFHTIKTARLNPAVTLKNE